ncbi:MAG TPA: diadenylate cyclase CdaA [Candidatus Binatia bacterium]|nr:diadenylate cyclase CdaA [Candidatus Binatia bacterium]
MNESPFINPFPAITFSEVIDILVVATLLYTAVVWAQRTRAALVVRGILVFGAIYIIARYLDLQMTAWIFQGFFAIFLIIIVVIFQEELRRIFEQLAVWSLNFKKTRPSRGEAGDVIARTLADLARNKIGALIVLRGTDPLERHITGGIPLDGKVSAPLLWSIFDPHSPGHDGAVLVENGQITRFAAHLPLSKDISQTAQVGTRHSAALGLAELCDALCLVVSEERGTVSVARDGRLYPNQDLQQITRAIDSFYEAKFPTRETKAYSLEFFRQNWIAKAVSLSLAFGFWYILVPGSKTIRVNYRIPVSVEHLPPDLQIQELQPAEVNATFNGPRRAFYLLDAAKIKVTLDGAMTELGRRTFNISEQNIRYPKDLTLEELSPSSIRVQIEKVSRPADSNKS